jgi:hypothetical protein
MGWEENISRKCNSYRAKQNKEYFKLLFHGRKKEGRTNIRMSPLIPVIESNILQIDSDFLVCYGVLGCCLVLVYLILKII